MGKQRLAHTSAQKSQSKPAMRMSLKTQEEAFEQLQTLGSNRAVNESIAAQQLNSPSLLSPPNNHNHSAPHQPIQAKPSFQGLSQELGNDAAVSNEQLLKPKDAGKKMPPEVQQKMETPFNTDFSDVRIHEGPEADAIGAIAFTRGADIFFSPGKYSPNSLNGQKILGHELTHVTQQRYGQVPLLQNENILINTNSRLESEADRLGEKASRGEGSGAVLPQNTNAISLQGVNVIQCVGVPLGKKLEELKKRVAPMPIYYPPAPVPPASVLTPQPSIPIPVPNVSLSDSNGLRGPGTKLSISPQENTISEKVLEIIDLLQN